MKSRGCKVMVVSCLLAADEGFDLEIKTKSVVVKGL